MPEIILTFDNLGEAAEEELGLQPPPSPHPSVAAALPRILELLLATHDLRATFFVEAINAERYPEAIGAIVAAGHELGCHGWRHETWHPLSDEAKRATLARCADAFAPLAPRPVGFRPPGGVIGAGDARLLTGGGIAWVSPSGSRAGIQDGLVLVPFAWPEIDAYYFAEALAPLREADGLPASVLGADAFMAAARGAIARALTTGEPLCLVLHPFLYDRAERWDALDALLGELGRLCAAGDAQVGSGAAAVERLRAAGALAAPPLFDQATWSSASSTTGEPR